MKLMRIGSLGRERPVVQNDSSRHFDLTPITPDVDGSFLESDGIERTRRALAAGALPEVDVDGQRIGAPVARPAAVMCIGQNYAAHAAESGDSAPERPVLFFKHPNTVVGPYDDVVIPRNAKRTDWEVELAVVIGQRARYLESVEDALSHVAGLTISNDVSEREFQTTLSGGQWSKGKCCETFNPMGPWLVPLDEVSDLQAMALRSWVNGDLRQDSTTKDMIFSVASIVHHLSQFLVLEPGDVINTGTPQGVALSGRFPYLKAGDVMELEIEGLGRQRQDLVAEGAGQ
jgi:2-keto-4-pentenoate hydratase/2-oxohepta-3-ene-1,7-dioic acid hydratase in catechol pathway